MEAVEEKKQTETPDRPPEKSPKKEKSEYIISSAPHIRNEPGVAEIMWTVVFALLPSMGMALYFFRLNAVILILVSSSAALAGEFLVNILKKEKRTVFDGSALLTGILFALTLPPNLHPAMAALGALFAILIGKHAFGGLGYNIFNPAILGRAFLQASYPVEMTTWSLPSVISNVDAVSSATPLMKLKFESTQTGIEDLIYGYHSGSLGETSMLAIIAGGLILLFKQYADWKIPLSILASVTVSTLALNLLDGKNINPLQYIFSGGLMFGAFFMATDMVTSPITSRGTWVYGAGIGLLVVIIRRYSGLPEGVMYSILIFNGLTPLIDKYFRPKYYGETR